MLRSVGPEKLSGIRLFVRSKSSEPTPGADAVTLYEPAVALALAVTDATPSDPMVAAGGESSAEAPLLGAAKAITPPATGSTEFLALIVTARGLGNGNSSVVDCGVLPATRVRTNPWLWNAPMSGLGESSGSPRWSDVIPLACVPAPIAGLPGRRAMVSVGPP